MTININKILATEYSYRPSGTPMGARDVVEDLSRLYIQKVQMIGGDYAPDGTYWGGSPKHGYIYCAFDESGYGTRIWVRAHSRAEAVLKVVEKYPEARFIRSIKPYMSKDEPRN